MAKPDPEELPKEVIPPNPSAEKPPITQLADFCRFLSLSDKRVSMIGAFFGQEKRAGRMHDTEANYKKRYEAFCCAPA